MKGLSLKVQAGELYGLVGPDGAGKTTAIRMLTGLVNPSAGEALVLGQSAQKGSRLREAIGYMPQQYSLYGDLSVHENLRFFGRLFGLSRREFGEREDRLLHITRLARFRDRRAEALSGGMYKKLALACALLHRPRVLVMDEPTNGVDPVSRRELWDLLYEFVSQGMAVLLATPYMDEASRCHKVGLLSEGRLLTEGSPSVLVASMGHRALFMEGPDRTALEQAIENRFGRESQGGARTLLAITPLGAGLRVLLAGDAVTSVVSWAEASPLVSTIRELGLDFEDVFLGLVAAPDASPDASSGVDSGSTPGAASSEDP